MKLRIFLIALAGCLMLSACGGVETTPETSAAAAEVFTEAPETFAPETAAVDTTEATVVTEEAYT